MPTPKSQLAEAVQEAAEQPLKQDVLLSLLGYNFRRAYLTVVPLFEERMARHALRAVDLSVMSLLKANPNITQKRLSQAINVSPPNLAILLDGLEGRGLVLRQRNPFDKRSQTLVLTDDGLQLCNQAEKTAMELDLEACATLSADERAQLLKLLQKVFLGSAPI